MVGPPLPHGVSALAAKGDLTFAAAGGAVEECRRAHRSGAYTTGSPAAARVTQLLVIGDALLGLCPDARRLLVWRVGQYGAPERAVEFEPGFAPTCACHPDTYLNKVVVGAADGRLQLWNFATGAHLHTFSGWCARPQRWRGDTPVCGIGGAGAAPRSYLPQSMHRFLLSCCPIL